MIIGMSGIAGSGKDSTANIIIKKRNRFNKKRKIKNKQRK